MNCPVCSVSLAMSAREGVEIDYCPKCRGVWLDRGEIDKIIEKAMQQQSPPSVTQTQNLKRHDDDDFDDDDDRRRYQQQPPPMQYQNQYPPKKRKGFLGEIFDWD